MLESFLQDVRYAVRVLRRSTAFTAVAIASLALGIGANAAIFQLLDAVRLRSLPIPHPEQLATIGIVGGNHGMGLNPGGYGGLTGPIWEALRRDHPAFSGLFAWEQREQMLGRGRERRRARTLAVTGEYFQVLGIQPLRGRLLLPADETAACPSSTMVVSYAWWQSAMGGRELGPDTAIVIDDVPRQVVGVTPPGFFGLAVGDGFDLVLPYCGLQDSRRDVFALTVMGRLAPDVPIDRASAQLAAASAGIFESTAITGYGPDTVARYKAFTLSASAASKGVSSLRARYDASLWLLLGITGLVLLIACANLANLLLARASVRSREMALRLALGASRGRLLRQLLVESGLLAIAGAALGVALARVLSGVLIQSISTSPNSVTLPLTMDWHILLFATAVAAGTCALFGLVPALRATDTAPAAAMRADGRGLTASRERFSMQRLLVVAQVAVSLVLLVGALLFVRSFRNLTTFDAGVRQDGIIMAFVAFPQMARDMTPARAEALQKQLLDEMRAVPGVLSAATTTNVPLLGSSWTLGVTIDGAEGGSKFTWVSPDYLRTMGMTLVAGRNLEERDTSTSRRVAVVNQTFVRTFLGPSNPMGHVMRTGAEPNYPATEYEIVGVIADTKYSGLREETPPMTFAPASQFPASRHWVSMVIHARTPPATATAEIARAVAAQHPDAIFESRVFQTEIRNRMLRERLMAMLAGFFGLLAALLAMVGLYGVISYLVTRRRQEIGIRLALGAGRGQMVRMVLREAARLLAAGLAIGTALALVAGRGAGSLLFGLTPHDPAALLGACALLAFIAACASILPARRAANLDPMIALRDE
jgi:predicted permease